MAVADNKILEEILISEEVKDLVDQIDEEAAKWVERIPPSFLSGPMFAGLHSEVFLLFFLFILFDNLFLFLFSFCFCPCSSFPFLFNPPSRRKNSLKNNALSSSTKKSKPTSNSIPPPSPNSGKLFVR